MSGACGVVSSAATPGRRERATGLALLLAAIAVMVLRRPEYLTSPGFWAEEGTFYFAGAWRLPWSQALLARPTGYFVLWTNLPVVLAAHLVALDRAPLVTTLFALVAQTVPLAIVALGLAPEWRGAARKATGIAIVLFASLTGEIWLSTLNCQFHLGLAAALLLLEPARLARARSVTYALLLTVAGLTGVAAASLAPLFALRAWHAKTRSAAALAGVALACALLQVFAVWSAGPLAPSRQAGMALSTLALVIWMKTLVLPMLGVEVAHRFVRAAVALIGSDFGAPAARVLGGGLFILAGAVLAAFGWRLSPRTRLALVGSYVLFTAGAILGGIGDRRMFIGHADNSSRYFYAPGALVLFLLMANACEPARRRSLGAAACATLLITGVVLGMLRYRESLRWRPWWPQWRQEVAAWERDPGRPLAIWPPPNWQVSLSRPGGARARR